MRHSSWFHLPWHPSAPTTGSPEGSRPDTRAWLVLAAMTAATALAVIDISVVVVALPSIDRDMSLSSGEMGWIVNAYLLTFTVLVATAGRLADVVGPGRTLAAGLVGFMGFSVMAGLSASPEMLIGARAGQGAAVAFVAPAAITIGMAAFPREWAGRVAGLLSGASIVFGTVAPLIGGILTEVDWRLVFFVNLPVGVLALAGLLALRPGAAARDARGIDWAGFGVFTVGVLLVVIPLMGISGSAIPAAGLVAMAVAGVLALVWFLRIERRAASPMLDIALARDRAFLADSSAKLLIQLSLKGLTIVLPVYFQVELGLDPIEAGLAFLPSTIPMLFAPPLGGALYDRIGPRVPSVLGAALGAAGLAWLAIASGQDAYAPFIPGQLLLGLGLGMAFASTTADGIARAGEGGRNAALGVMKTTGMLGGLVGVAVIGGIASADGGGTGEALVLSAISMALAALVLAVGLGPRAGAPGQPPADARAARSTT